MHLSTRVLKSLNMGNSLDAGKTQAAADRSDVERCRTCLRMRSVRLASPYSSRRKFQRHPVGVRPARLQSEFAQTLLSKTETVAVYPLLKLEVRLRGATSSELDLQTLPVFITPEIRRMLFEALQRIAECELISGAKFVDLSPIERYRYRRSPTGAY